MSGYTRASSTGDAGAAGAVAWLQALESKLSNPAPFFEAVASHLKAVAERSFATESEPGGAKWAPLSATTKALRRAAGYPEGPILTLTGALRKSIESSVEAGADCVADITVGSKLDYAGHHQRGGRKKPPRRSFLGTAPDTPAAIDAAFAAFIGK